MPVHLLLFYLTLIFLPTQLGLHTWPNWALILGRRIDYLSPTLFFTDILLLLTLCFWIIFQKKCSVSKKQIIIMLGIFLVMVINTLFTASPLVAGYKWIKIIECIWFGYYLYKVKPALRTTTLMLSLGAAYSSILGLLQFYLQHSLGGIFWFLGERTFTVMTPGIARVNWCWLMTNQCQELLRPYATFSHPNVLAGFLIIVMFLLGYNLQTEKIKKFRLWSYGVLGLSFVTILITFSRNAWITGICAVLFLVLFSKKKFKNRNIVWLGILLLACVGVLLPYFLTLFFGGESVAIRYSLAIAALHLFFTHPLMGVGLGGFLIQLPSVSTTRDLFFIQPVHNIFLLWIVETGILGCVTVGLLLRKYIAFLKVHKTPTIVTIPLILILMLGLFDHYPFTLQQGQLLFTLCVALPFLYFKNS